MARKARFTDALPVYDTPDMREAINELANAAEVSQAAVIRTILRHGLPGIQQAVGEGKVTWQV